MKEQAYTFTVPGEPITWKRARRGRGHSYTDPADAAHREKIRAYARQFGIRRALKGPVGLRLLFVSARADDPTDQRVGDLDNLEKAVKDALQGIAYLNDRQVVEVSKAKRTAHEYPRTEIALWTVHTGGAGETSG